ncbi:6-phosphogluconolactonase (cycloisomerase 2 family) [Haloactinopolyspora alba]|uniref:6-phosphogluconolactonase (Cycloisomerase 2 family) n=1 Tax=Haloactinopolyspora alba TaxID=648780 RepID=A0A2P8D196_9ACTN|nr:lactonase family protein [Haloactinopolyspora alba]PSK90987.1 6-phosphogluconolactonase (cycloisomerase 2 family) [Haloactinopolyspora alba]
MHAFIGAATSSGQGSRASGITVVEVRGSDMTALGTGAGTVENPMYVAVAPGGDIVYTVHESPDGAVSAWRADDGALSPLGVPRATGGKGPCHLSVHPRGRHLLAADYGSGSVSVHPVDADGSVGERTDRRQYSGSGPVSGRQDGPHAHMAVTDPGSGPGRGHVLVTDLGTDTLHRYDLDESTGRLTDADRIAMPPGSGPRHLVVQDRFAYVVGELDSTVSVVDLTSATVVGTASTHPGGEPGDSLPSGMRLGADGRFLYVANRFADEIAVLSVDGETVRWVAALPCGGTHPRDLALDPAGERLFVANQFSDDVASFRVEPSSGLPQPDGVALRTPSPACIAFG